MTPGLRRTRAERTGASIVATASPNVPHEAANASSTHAVPSPWTATAPADVDATPVAGNWRYLRKTPRRAARARARQSDTESDDDDPPRRRARPRA